MNQPMLLVHETQGLVKIVEEANKSFLRESHSLERSSFNILRILSTFRLLYPQSPSNLYNAIIYITKNYDPQTYFQWKKAISQLSRSKNSLARIKSNYCRPDVSIYTKTYQNSFNRERLNESCQHQKSKSYAQINIPQQISYSKQPSIDQDQFQKDASQTNAQTGKRQFYTKADSISHVSKNHYISFQPYRNSTSDYRNHFDKENINSTNIEESRRRQSAYQYIQAMQRDLNRTAKPSQVKTPIDQSFIKNMHNESPYLYAKTLQEIPDPIQQQMNARSLTFYHYNLKLKGYSSLQANCYVFLKAKQEEMKAKIRHRSTLLSKSFLGFSQNMKYQRNQKNQLRKAEDFYELSMMKKIFEVLKLIFILKREQDQNKDGKQFANPINLEFITTLLFTAGSQAGQDIIDFNKKVNELLWSEQSSKLHSISKYFGKNSWMKLQNIQDLIKAYKKSLSIKVFSILRNQLTNNKKYDAVRQLNLKRFALFALKIKQSRAACYKHKIQAMRAKMDRSTMQKIMKSLIQIVYSNKLYSKKCEYIVRKHSNTLKLTSLQIWNEKARQSLIEKNRMKKNIESLFSVVTTLIGKLCLRKIVAKSQEIDMLTIKIQEQNMNLKKIFVLRNLKSNSTRLKEKKEIQRLQKNVKLNLSLKKWKQSTRKGKVLNRITKILRNYVFKTILIPHFQQLVQDMREKIISENKILKKAFTLLHSIANSNRQIEEYQIKCLTHKFNILQKKKAINSLTQNFHRQAMIKINEDNLKKTHLLQLSLLKFQCKKLFDNCSNNKAIRKDDQFAFKKLQQRVKYHKMTKIYRQLKENHYINKNTNKLLQNVYLSKAGRIYSQMVSLIIERKINKVFAVRKRNCSHSLSNILVQSHRIQSEKKNKASNHNTLILKYKCFEGLKDIFEKSKMVEKIAEKMIRRQIYTNTKEKLILANRETKIRKIAEKREIKLFFQNLQKITQFKKYRQKLYQITYQNMANSFLLSLQLHEEILEQKNNFNSSSIILRKFIGINRLKTYFTAILIDRKHQYMALKFRALKLILCAFKGLQVKKVRKGGHKALAERLSTDLVG